MTDDMASFFILGGMVLFATIIGIDDLLARRQPRRQRE
jgi:hypothetical protein